jgi:hypothetical protein
MKRINSAYLKMSVFMPLDAKSYQQLTDDEIEHIDQFLFRLAKLQDIISEKLFQLLLEFFKEENIRNKPFIDLLNRRNNLAYWKIKMFGWSLENPETILPINMKTSHNKQQKL